MSKKILIIGASGFVGSYLFNALNINSTYEIIGTFKKNKRKGLIKFDYSLEENFKLIDEIKPDIIIWAAGEKNLKKTEVEISKTLDKSFTPLKTLINQDLSKNNSKIIFLSSDYVFDGDKGDYTIYDKTIPKSFYGISKFKSEKYIINNHSNYNIIRAGAIIGEKSVFINWLIQSLNDNSKLDLYDNLFSPTPIINLLNCIEDIIQEKHNEKIIHITGGKKLSRFDLGLFVAKILNSSNKIIKKSYKESEIKFFKDLSLISSYRSKKDMEIKDYIYKMIK
jgi:dTDP-4-dehydrorhamnose reductase